MGGGRSIVGPLSDAMRLTGLGIANFPFCNNFAPLLVIYRISCVRTPQLTPQPVPDPPVHTQRAKNSENGWLVSSFFIALTPWVSAWLRCLADDSAMSDRGDESRRDDDRSSRDRERSRSRDRDRAAEEPPKRRSRFSDAPAGGSGFSDGPPAAAAGFSAAVPLDARAAAMALAQQLSQKFMSGAGAAAGAAPAGFSSGGAGLSSLFSGGGGGGFGGGGGGGGPPPGEPPPPPGKSMGTAKRWNMEKGFGASTRPPTNPPTQSPRATPAPLPARRSTFMWLLRRRVHRAGRGQRGRLCACHEHH